jgi:DNA polymerase-4
MLEKLDHISGELQDRLDKNQLAGKTVTLKIKYSDFKLQTRSKTLASFVSSKSMILAAARELLYQDRLEDSVRLLGIALSNLNTDDKTSVAENDTVSVQLRFDF